MADELEVASESAKAVQEAAKFGSKVLEVASELGAFVARVIGGPLEEASGIAQDKLRFIRERSRLRFQHEYEALAGGQQAPRAIPPNVAIPLLQEGMFQEDTALQDLWIAMLANGTDPNAPEIRRSFVEILRQLDPSDAALLGALYAKAPDPDYWEIPTDGLPDDVRFGGVAKSDPQISPEVDLSLRNLIRVGVIDSGMFWESSRVITSVYQTPLGWALFNACERSQPAA